MKELLKEYKQAILYIIVLLLALACLFGVGLLSLWICTEFCQQYKAVSAIIAFAVAIVAAFVILLFGGKLNVNRPFLY
jgi:putative flippase GtrA